MEEIWKPLVYEDIQTNKYSISNTQKIKINKTGKIMKPFIDIHGYVEYGLCTNKMVSGNKRYSKDYKMHILMMNSFGNQNDIDYYNKNKSSRKVVINHKDGNKTNNDISNLEVVTQQYNIIHSIETGLRKSGLSATSFYWLDDEMLYKITELLTIRTPTNIIIDKLDLLKYGNSKKQIRQIINNIYCGLSMSNETITENLKDTKIDVPRPITYTDDDIRFICDKIVLGYRNCEIVEMLYSRLGYDGAIKTKRRYKALVSNIRNKVHRVDISSNYNF